jgi:hypothetical protein
VSIRIDPAASADRDAEIGIGRDNAHFLFRREPVDQARLLGADLAPARHRIGIVEPAGRGDELLVLGQRHFGFLRVRLRRIDGRRPAEFARRGPRHASSANLGARTGVCLLALGRDGSHGARILRGADPQMRISLLRADPFERIDRGELFRAPVAQQNFEHLGHQHLDRRVSTQGECRAIRGPQQRQRQHTTREHDHVARAYLHRILGQNPRQPFDPVITHHRDPFSVERTGAVPIRSVSTQASLKQAC